MNLCISNVTQSIVLKFVENLKKYLVFLSFFLGKCDYMELPSKHSCNYKVHLTVIIYFLALYSQMKDGNFMNRNFIFQIFLV